MCALLWSRAPPSVEAQSSWWRNQDWIQSPYFQIHYWIAFLFFTRWIPVCKRFLMGKGIILCLCKLTNNTTLCIRFLFVLFYSDFFVFFTSCLINLSCNIVSGHWAILESRLSFTINSPCKKKKSTDSSFINLRWLVTYDVFVMGLVEPIKVWFGAQGC